MIRRYLPDGSVRAIWDDGFDARKALEAVPHRASRIEVIDENGPRHGLFHVDFSPLADAVGRDEFRVCLVETFTRYEDARRAEVEWLKCYYVLEPA